MVSDEEDEDDLLISMKGKVKGSCERRFEFGSAEEWKEHIERGHFLRFAWWMGDGPKVTGFDGTKEFDPNPNIIPTFLTDLSGRQVTPAVTGQRIEEGSAKENNARRFRRRREGVHMVLEPVRVDDTEEGEEGEEGTGRC